VGRGRGREPVGNVQEKEKFIWENRGVQAYYRSTSGMRMDLRSEKGGVKSDGGEDAFYLGVKDRGHATGRDERVVLSGERMD